jgi:hypothetical protein
MSSAGRIWLDSRHSAPATAAQVPFAKHLARAGEPIYFLVNELDIWQIWMAEAFTNEGEGKAYCFGINEQPYQRGASSRRPTGAACRASAWQPARHE